MFAAIEARRRDAMVQVTGCLASNLQSAVAQLGASVTGELLVGEAFYPNLEKLRGGGRPDHASPERDQLATQRCAPAPQGVLAVLTLRA